MTTAALILFSAATLHSGSAQETPSTGPIHAGYTDAVTARHSHDGPLGDKLLYIEQLIRCTCGCTLDTHTCQYTMQCAESPAFSQRIMEALEAGESEEVILAGFVADFGPEILASPPMEGFNRVGYLMPGVAIVFSGLLIGLFVRRNTNRPRKQPVPVSNISERDWERLREEMKTAERERW